MRTRLQHAWGTAVEQVGAAIEHDLKSGHGPEEILLLFQHCGRFACPRGRARTALGRYSHFLLVFDHAAGKLIEQREFDDVDAAMAAYEEREAKYDKTASVEVVLIGADSIETVRLTHANYFDGTAALAHALARILKETRRATPSPS